MRITLKRSLALAAVCVGMAGSPASAQDSITATVPFDFIVNGQPFHAGKYEVKMNAAEGTADVVSVRGQDGKTFLFVLTTAAGGQDPKGAQPALVFTRHERTYALSQIWESDLIGRAVPKS